MTTSRRPPKVTRPSPVPRVNGLLDTMTPLEALKWWQRRTTPHVVRDGDDGALFTFVREDHGADQVLLWANRLADETDLSTMLMRRLEGTGLWHATFRMPTAWRASYCFLTVQPGGTPAWLNGDQVALRGVLDQGLVDPRNPDTSFNGLGVTQSVVSGPDAPAQPWRGRRPEVAPGTLEAATIDGRSAWVHTPVDLRVETPAPTLVVLDGEVWSTAQDLPTTLDNLYADGAVPVHRTVFLSAGDRDQRWSELGDVVVGPGLVLDRVVPWTREHLAPSGDVTLVGQSLGGMTALRVGLRAPEVVGCVVSQSASLWQDDLRADVEAYAARAGGAPLRVHLTHGTEEWVLAEAHDLLARRLEEAGASVTARAYLGGHDYAWWRGAVADGLVDLAREGSSPVVHR